MTRCSIIVSHHRPSTAETDTRTELEDKPLRDSDPSERRPSIQPLQADRESWSRTSRNTLSVASFNIHAGVDGWARPFDVESRACREIATDVIVIQECFDPDGAASQAREVADELGFDVLELPLRRGRVLQPFAPSRDETSWGPPPTSTAPSALRLEGPPIRRRGRARAIELSVPSRRGSSSGTACRIDEGPHSRRARILELPRLAREMARPGRLSRRSSTSQNGPPAIVGTHLGHLSRGSVRQMRAIARHLRDSSIPTALVGDMNCWGPPLVAAIPGFRRAVLGRTWPAWRPHSQIDHILLRGPVEVLEFSVLGPFGSDHRPVRASLRLGQ